MEYLYDTSMCHASQARQVKTSKVKKRQAKCKRKTRKTKKEKGYNKKPKTKETQKKNRQKTKEILTKEINKCNMCHIEAFNTACVFFLLFAKILHVSNSFLGLDFYFGFFMEKKSR